MFFFFFGEFLFLVTFNFNTLADAIPSSYFLTLKSHIVFLTQNTNQFLNNVIFFYILFFTSSSLKFLLNLRYSFEYQHLKSYTVLDFTFLSFIVFLFLSISPLCQFPYVPTLVLLVISLLALRLKTTKQAL